MTDSFWSPLGQAHLDLAGRTEEELVEPLRRLVRPFLISPRNPG